MPKRKGKKKEERKAGQCMLVSGNFQALRKSPNFGLLKFEELESIKSVSIHLTFALCDRIH